MTAMMPRRICAENVILAGRGMPAPAAPGRAYAAIQGDTEIGYLREGDYALLDYIFNIFYMLFRQAGAIFLLMVFAPWGCGLLEANEIVAGCAPNIFVSRAKETLSGCSCKVLVLDSSNHPYGELSTLECPQSIHGFPAGIITYQILVFRPRPRTGEQFGVFAADHHETGESSSFDLWNFVQQAKFGFFVSSPNGDAIERGQDRWPCAIIRYFHLNIDGPSPSELSLSNPPMDSVAALKGREEIRISGGIGLPSRLDNSLTASLEGKVSDAYGYESGSKGKNAENQRPFAIGGLAPPIRALFGFMLALIGMPLLIFGLIADRFYFQLFGGVSVIISFPLWGIWLLIGH
jgi:hypothetical protein